jgi:adenylate kinase family enzyme
MIIHINGASGAGKSTLGAALKKAGYYVIETDDIDDDIMLKLIKKYPNSFDTAKAANLVYKIHDKLYEDAFKALIKKHKNIIFVGLIHHKKKRIENVIASKTQEIHKYYIKVDPEVNFKRLLIRTMNDLCKNRQAIENLINSSKNLNTMDKLLLYKYKIRTSIPFDDIASFIKKTKKREMRNKKEGYQVLGSKEIYNAVVGILK